MMEKHRFFRFLRLVSLLDFIFSLTKIKRSNDKNVLFYVVRPPALFYINYHELSLTQLSRAMLAK